MPSGEATNTNFIVFGLTRSGFEPMIYSTRGKHANHCTNDQFYFCDSLWSFWVEVNAGFLLFVISVLTLEIKKRESWDSIIRFNPATFLCLSQVKNLHFHLLFFVFYDLRWEVCLCFERGRRVIPLASLT